MLRGKHIILIYYSFEIEDEEENDGKPINAEENYESTDEEKPQLDYGEFIVFYEIPRFHTLLFKGVDLGHM